jgi:hypothetical protein
VQHAFEPPVRGEPVHPDHVMQATRGWLERYGQRPSGTAIWVWQFPGEYSCTLRSGRSPWNLARGQTGRADVTVIATPEAWARFLTQLEERRLPSDDVQLTAKPAAAKAFARAFAAKLDPHPVQRPAARS